MKEAEEVKVSDVPKDKQKIFKINRGKAREKGGPLTKAEKGGKPQEEMFAMDTPELKEVEKMVDLLVDSSVQECPGEENAMQNEPTDEPEEQLDRVHKDIAGYGDPEEEEQEYPPGPQDDDRLLQQVDDDFGTHGGEGIGEQLEVILNEHPYNDFFKSMMDKEGLSGLKGQSKEKISSFFKKVSAEWKLKKKVSSEGLSEDILISVPVAAAVILGPYFLRLRKLKKAAKLKCAKFSGVANKRCLIRIDIETIKKEMAATRKSMSYCNKAKTPKKKARCKKALQGLIKDYQVKIKKKEAQIKAL